jgi:hypothetical protein
MQTPFGHVSTGSATTQAPKQSMSTLTDTDISTNLYHGQTVNYDATTDQWKNGYEVPCWRDLIGQTSTKGEGSTVPPMQQFRGTIWQTGFNVAGNTIYYFLYHLPHDLVKGTDLFIHAHHSTNSTTETGQLAFQLQASYAAVGSEISDPIALESIEYTHTGASDQYVHHVTEVPLSTQGGSRNTLDSDLLDTDGLIFIRLRRQTSDTLTDPGALFLFEVDVHYQSMVGGTVNRSAPFRE